MLKETWLILNCTNDHSFAMKADETDDEIELEGLRCPKCGGSIEGESDRTVLISTNYVDEIALDEFHECLKKKVVRL